MTTTFKPEGVLAKRMYNYLKKHNGKQIPKKRMQELADKAGYQYPAFRAALDELENVVGFASGYKDGVSWVGYVRLRPSFANRVKISIDWFETI